MLHGKIYDRWFDKSINLVVGKNGRVWLFSNSFLQLLVLNISKSTFVGFLDWMDIGYPTKPNFKNPKKSIQFIIKLEKKRRKRVVSV
jgi:hypothetical protein